MNIALSVLTSLVLLAYLTLEFSAPSGLLSAGLLACSPVSWRIRAWRRSTPALRSPRSSSSSPWKWLSAPGGAVAVGVAITLSLAMLAKSTALILPIPALAVVRGGRQGLELAPPDR